MTKGEIIVSLDIGTSKIRAIIGEYNGSTLSIIGVGSADGEGIRKGSIVDIDKTVQSIQEAVEHAERMVGIQIDSAFIGITGNHIALQPSQGVVAVSSPDREIGEEDVERVLQAAKVIAVPPEREIIGIVPKQYIVDGLDEINDPRGMIGVRLEVEGSIVTGSRTIISNLLRCVERAGVKNSGLILMPLAASSIALSSDEKKLGVVLVDIGAGQTTISVFENGALSALSVLPIGGDHITNDIAIGLRTQTEVAESIKLRYGRAMVAGSSQEITFKVPRIGSNVDKEFTQGDLASIIEPRLQEIFLMIRREVEQMGYVKEIPSGYVLSGGVACLQAVDKLAEFELNSPVRIAIPEHLGVRDASFVNGVGIIQYAIRNFMRRAHTANSSPVHRKSGGFIERVKNWFSEFV